MFLELAQFLDEPTFSVAILIARTNNGGNHTGIITKYDKEFKFFHLAWHLNLKCDSFNIATLETDFKLVKWVKFKFLTSDSFIAEIRVPTIIKHLELIYKKNQRKIPYSIKFKNTRFTSEGDLKLEVDENGLTCATFVASVLSSNAIELVDLSTWPSREQEDNAFKQLVIKSLKKSKTFSDALLEEHIANVTKEEINFRIKPEEIAVSSSREEADLPADFAFCSVEGAIFNSM